MDGFMDEADQFILEELDNAENSTPVESENLEEYEIPSWADLKKVYNSKWMKEKKKFVNKLKYNFQNLLVSNRSGKQEIFVLTIRNNKTKLYEKAFRELFHDPNYGASIGEIETLAGKRVKRLYIVMPEPW
jgi:hypothetical protein|tara:strand:+ start:172 stop:564 length:393 start_codon:yes stop_codon:yes gene_type:complete